MQDLRRFFKANPQVLVLLIICLVLGLGTFLAVVFGVVTSKSPTTPSGEPSGSLGRRVALVARMDNRRRVPRCGPGADTLDDSLAAALGQRFG